MNARACVLGLAAVVAIATTATAASLNVPIALRGPQSTKGLRATVTLTPVQVTGLERSNALAGSTDIPGLFAVEGLLTGTWMIEVAAPGYWHQPQVQFVGTDATTVPFNLWPTMHMKGTVSTPSGNAPSTLLLRFQSSPEVSDSDRLPVSEIKCPVQEGQWQCDVPAGKMDLRFRLPGYQTEFRWDVQVKAGETRDWGAFKLRQGSSIVGAVTCPSGSLPLTKARVSAEPSEAREDRSRKSIRTVLATPNERGFFRLAGLSAGEYSVTAIAGEMRSNAVRVAVVHQRETELLDPLILQPPRRLAVRLVPPLTPAFRPWRVALFSVSRQQAASELITEERAGEDGTWKRRGLYDGQYKLFVMNDDGARWLVKELDLSEEDLDLMLDIPMMETAGSVRLGGKPVPAKVIFGGDTGEVRVTLQADDHGEFKGVLPAVTWDRITVQSSAPPVKRTIVKPEFAVRDGRMRVDLKLPATLINGVIVDEAGKPVERAIVRVDDDGDDWGVDAEASPDGSFQLVGIPPGGVRIQASAYLRESDVIRLQLREDETAQVRLVLKATDTVVGRVVAAGGPVAGARVVVAPTDSQPMAVIPVATNMNGEFGAVVQPGTREANLSVEAHGYAVKMFHLTLPADGKSIEIPLDANGGTLIIECPQFDGYGRTPAPYVMHAGADRHVLSFSSATLEPSGDARLRVTVPLLERGLYSVCLATEVERQRLRTGALPKERCSSGFLPSLGTLTLRVGG